VLVIARASVPLALDELMWDFSHNASARWHLMENASGAVLDAVRKSMPSGARRHRH
jgi:NAD(P)H-hydrate repair Nnr-like enzyme with NAD(P)H-hydrate epimerase domain